MPTHEQPLSIVQEGPVATIRFTQPKTLNAITLSLAQALTEAFTQLSRAPGLRVIVLCGDGRAFMAGGDLLYLRDAPPERAAQDASALITQLHEAINAMAACRVPILASVHGAVAGAGISLMLACDYAIAEATTRFIFAYSAIAASPDGGLTWALPRAIGLRKSMEFAFLEPEMNAQTAHTLGLVNRLVPAVELGASTAAIAAQLAAVPTLAFGQTKRLMQQSLTHSLPEQLNSEREGFAACARTADFREGVAAFFERRTAQFDGR